MFIFLRTVVLVIIVLFILNFLTSCSSISKTEIENHKVIESSVIAQKEVEAAASAKLPQFTMSSSPQMWVKRVAVREYINRSQPLRDTDYNLVVFISKPQTKKQLEKALYICNIWKDSIPSQKAFDQLKRVNSDLLYIPFYWPLKKEIKDESCETLIENYDYERVQLLSQVLSLKTKTPQFLYRTKKAIVSMDLSVIDESTEIYSAMEIWRENMCLHFSKDTKLNPITLIDSVKKVLGSLNKYLNVKT